MSTHTRLFALIHAFIHLLVTGSRFWAIPSATQQYDMLPSARMQGDVHAILSTHYIHAYQHILDKNNFYNMNTFTINKNKYNKNNAKVLQYIYKYCCFIFIAGILCVCATMLQFGCGITRHHVIMPAPNETCLKITCSSYCV